MEILSSDLVEYLENHTVEKNPLLEELERETHLKVLMPQMVSGHLAGSVLSTFSLMLKPNKVLEIGTFTGYSAICLASGLAKDGLLITIDVNEELEAMVADYLAKAGLEGKVKHLIGKAEELIPELSDTFDLVFIDADKQNYAKYFDLVIDKVRPGGVILADNVLWSGKVYDSTANDKDTLAIRHFNQKVTTDKRVANYILPIRDGLMVAVKLA